MKKFLIAGLAAVALIITLVASHFYAYDSGRSAAYRRVIPALESALEFTRR